MKPGSSVKFKLPPKGMLAPNGSDDPLKYYYVPLVSKLFISRINITLRLLNDLSFDKSLEIGYGSGVLLPTLSKLSNQVYGVDIGSDPKFVVEQLKALGCNPTLSTGIADKLLFEDNYFDLVVAVSVLEHIKDIEPFLTEIHRVIRPGGFLLVGMPAVNSFMEKLFAAIGFSGISNHHVTSPEIMHKAANGMFTLKDTGWMPGFLPSNFYLYKSFLFQK
ncbi:MAG: class I SAM-dependent methyltransferase [bacterium]|jgi:2-polyprenyl-3-methyl-5-hydroxy-6-metoxy-1,4-benzoquinol methylase|nr:class I SAM-dependent methyltransferase [bacterium]